MSRYTQTDAFKSRRAEHSLRYRKENPEKVKASKAAYYQSNKRQWLEKTREWAANNPDRTVAIKRRHHLMKSYGMTPQEFMEMYERQSRRCGICEKGIALNVADGASVRNRAVVDHCHSTGVVRGLLCDPCNNMLGRASDNPATLRRAAEYVEASKP
jgi:hypothetical protein